MVSLELNLSNRQFDAPTLERIEQAYQLALQAHAGQTRKSGEPYISHPVAVAQTLADWNLDPQAIMAGLLHDTVEDTPVTLDQLRHQFGKTVAELVDGVTKLNAVEAQATTDGNLRAASAENLRKLLLAMTKDLRVVMVKLADRLHNVSTLEYLAPDDRVRIARETLEIYAPLADRMGMGQLKAELEDKSFRYTQPEEYKHVKQDVEAVVKQSQRYLARLKRFLTDELAAAGIPVLTIESRQKHVYSVYKKLLKTDGEIDKLYDLMAVRVIVPEVADCYQALGIVHSHFKPLIYRIKDYIAVPKPNGYRSLHTTVLALDGRITEIQIRTPQMQQEAERGLAAHFYYDQQKGAKSYRQGGVAYLPSKLAWVGSLSDLHQAATTGGDNDLLDSVKLDLFQDRIFIFSPKGDLYDLPEGSTPLDFAFAVHSGLGLRTQGAKVNGRIVPLSTKLANRDVVEVLTRKQDRPNRDWLNFVQTSQAKTRIRSWFRAAGRDANIASGRAQLEEELGALGVKRLEDLPPDRLESAAQVLRQSDVTTLLAAIGDGSVSTGQVVRRLFPPEIKPAGTKLVSNPVATGRVVVAGKAELPYTLALCCQPAYPHSIVGFITRGSGVTIHRSNCSNLPTETDRYLASQWELHGRDRLMMELQVQAANRLGLLSDLTGLIAGQAVNIAYMRSGEVGADGLAHIELGVEADDTVALTQLIKKIEQAPGVLAVERSV